MGRRRGYNFLEVMVASLVFCTMILSLMSVWITHAHSVSKTRARLTGTYLAERQLEECLSRGYFGVDGLDNSSDPEGEEFRVKTTLRGSMSEFVYHYHVRVTQVGDGRKLIEVRVSWVESNMDQEVRLESLLSKAS